MRPPIEGPDDLAVIEAEPYAAYQPFASLGEALESVCARHAGRTAITYLPSADLAQPPLRWRYADLIRRLRQAANLFRALGVDDDHAVAFLLPAVPAAYLALLGGALAGRACPINYLLSPEHVAELLRACNARVAVVMAPCAELDLGVSEEALRARCPGLAHVLWVHEDAATPGGFDAQLDAQPADRLAFDRATGLDAIAACFHTGGTTGAPKLAQHTHGNQLHAAWSAARAWAADERDVVFNGFPLFHVAGAFVYGLSTLLAGGNVVLPTLTGLRNKAFIARYWQFVEREGATLLAAVPTVMSTLLAIDPAGARLDSVRALLTGGSPLPDELAASFEQRLGIPVRNILGMTECAGVIALEPTAAPRTPGACGLRTPFTQVCAVDEASLRPLPAGATGVLAVRGPQVSPGYADPACDGGTFIGDGWLVTGDVGHVDVDGRVFVTGRAKDVIIRSGHNIDPRAIEDALMAHPDVVFAAAVGEPDEYAGELPVAFVVLAPGAPRDVDALLAAVRRDIPERPAIPKRLTLLDALPTTAVGKVYRPALRRLAHEQAFRERLAARGLGARVEVSAREADKAIVLDFALAPNADDACAAEVRAMMAGFAIRYELVTAQAAPIDFWFDVISPYGWLASLRIDAIAARHGRAVRWRPMLLGVSVLKVMGLPPVMRTPLKRDYVPREIARYLRRHGLAMARDPAAEPMDPLPCARVFAWLAQHRPAAAKAFVREAMRRYWVDGEDMARPEALQSALPADAAPLADMLAEGAALLRAEVERGLAAGVFGSPFIVVDGEPFFGVDKLELVDEWLARGGW